MRLEIFLTCVFPSVIKGEKQALTTFEGNHDPIYKYLCGSVTKTPRAWARHWGPPEGCMVPLVTKLTFRRGDRTGEEGRVSLMETACCLAAGGVLIPLELPTSRQLAARTWD